MVEQPPVKFGRSHGEIRTVGHPSGGVILDGDLRPSRVHHDASELVGLDGAGVGIRVLPALEGSGDDAPADPSADVVRSSSAVKLRGQDSGCLTAFVGIAERLKYPFLAPAARHAVDQLGHSVILRIGRLADNGSEALVSGLTGDAKGGPYVLPARPEIDRVADRVTDANRRNAGNKALRPQFLQYGLFTEGAALVPYVFATEAACHQAEFAIVGGCVNSERQTHIRQY